VRGEDPRRDFAAPVPVEIVRADGTVESELAVNLSPRGVCVRLHKPIAVGESVWVVFSLPPAGPEIRATGKVVWTGHAGQIDAATQIWETGVHLLDLGEEARAALSQFASQPANRRR
jgi:Tfp pilus assembly protein PilZ